VVDDDRAVRFVLCTALREAGYQVLDFDSAAPALQALSESPPPALLFTDVRMPGDDGLVLLDKLKAALPQLPVVVMSAYTDVASTAGAFRGGAHEFLSKPFDLDDAVALAQRVLPAVAPALAAATPAAEAHSDQPPQLVGDTPPMRALFRAIGRLAQAPLAVLITGETGMRCIANHRARRGPSSRSIPLQSRPSCWKASCSATKPAPSPAHSAAISAASSRPMAARCSWMRSATCRCRCRPGCCACWRRASSSASVAVN